MMPQSESTGPMFSPGENVIEENEYVRRATFVDVEGGYELEITPGYSAQAVGTCYGVAFWFRGKHGQWEFETEDEHGHPFAADDPLAFRRCGEYKAISMAWATDRLQKCVAEMCTAKR